MTEQAESVRREFFGNGLFDWQMPGPIEDQASWGRYTFDLEKWWGTFPRDEAPAVQGRRDDGGELFGSHPWAIGPFLKYDGNPVLAPSPGRWDQGRYNGGVHNGAVVRHDNRFYYVYRGERPIDVAQDSEIDYICDIGVATSDDGIHFTKDDARGPLFRHGAFRRFSYEDVCLVRHDGVYHLFCNQWLWEDRQPALNGTFLATSTDLLHWHRHGIVFPQATRIHRNGCVVQDPENNAVRVNGRFVMYLNDGLIAYSDDLIHWESEPITTPLWPGGEGCFAVANHDPARPDDLVLFTGGHHHGHFYAIGQVLFSKRDPARAIQYLPRPMLAADPTIPHESGRRAQPPHDRISSFRDCIFFNALTRFDGRWWLYYGGSEYYTCLATAPAR